MAATKDIDKITLILHDSRDREAITLSIDGGRVKLRLTNSETARLAGYLLDAVLANGQELSSRKRP